MNVVSKASNRLNGLIVSSFALYIVEMAILFSLAGGGSDLRIIALSIVGTPFLGCVAGIVLLLTGKEYAGARTYQIASVFFIPLGALGMIGAAKIIDAHNERLFFESKGKHHANV